MNTAQPVLPILTITASATATDHVEVVRSASLLNLSSALREDNFSEISQQSMPNNSFIETACVQEISPINSTVAVATAAHSANRSDTPQAGPSHMTTNYSVAVAAAAAADTDSDTSPQAGPSKSVDIKCPECNRIFTCCHNHGRNKSKKENNKSTFQCPQCDKKYTLEQNLKRHIKSAHTNFQINCEYCKKIFKRSDVYKKHLYTQHNIED
ncbi:uncharacterized protein [Cardiocondyla obscurior]|uniref:uncharacterized protein n=1 Tax=Cardiocondyla obscurior TaxID=286306 RepID=UPI003965831C